MAPVPPKRSEILRQLFQPVGQGPANPDRRMAANYGVVQGSLVSFNYVFWRNDSYPLVIVSENDRYGGKLKGINLHYLTFPYIKQLLAMSANNPSFSYKSISGDEYVKRAYRTYKWSGVRQLKAMDRGFLLSVMSMVRSYDPAEVQIIRRQVREQIRKQINPKADQMTNLDRSDTGQNSIGD